MLKFWFRGLLPALALFGALLCGPARATTWGATTLADVAPGSATASFTAPDGLTLAVAQASGASLTGSDLFGYEGLWLGSDQAGGRYSLSFSAPVARVSFSFLALTALAGDGVESLTAFAADAALAIAFSSADGSASWNGSTLLALDEDARGVLTFTSLGLGFQRLSFLHNQPAALNGFIIDTVQASLASPVPEAHTLPMMALGLLLLLAACGGGSRPEEDAATARPLAVRTDGGVIVTTAPVTQRDAVRFAEQASFGPSEALVASLRSTGLEAWLAAQLALNTSRYTSGGGGAIHQPEGADFCASRGDDCWRDWYSTEPLVWDFYRNAVSQPDQLRQRLAYTLGQILVVSNVEVSGSYGFRSYHNALLANAFGSYREVLRRVALSPVMGDYLDHVNNSKTAPNENFARELLQLFSIGTCALKPDGSLSGGRCLPNYDNARVRDYAFALTGWTYPDGGSSVWGCWPEGANCTFYGGDMVARPALADTQARTLLGSTAVPAGRTPAQGLDAVLDSLMAHPSMPPFIGRQLIQHLVKSNPSPAYIQRVSSAFTAGRFQGATRSFGSGQRGDLAATVAAILLDVEARNSAPPLVAEKLREPVLTFTGVLRALNGSTDGDALGWWWGQALRQHLFRSPSVFAHFPPNYPVIGSRLVGPAFGVYNVNTALARLNFLNQLIPWEGMWVNDSVPGATGTSVDLSAFDADAGDATRLVDRLVAVATGGRMTAASKAAIVTAVNAWTPDQSEQWRRERVKTAAYLVFASPAYQVLQ
jgi:hypothetical protein